MKNFTALLGLTVVLASCGQSVLTTQPTPSTAYAILSNARAVPVLVGQAIAFDRHFESATIGEKITQQAMLAQADKLHTTTLEVKDLLGQPFNHLTFVTNFSIIHVA